MMCSSASEGKTRVMVSPAISTKLCVTREFTPKDIIQVLKENTGTSRIEILCFDISISEKEETLHWNGKAFGNVKNLEILIIRNGKVSRDPNCFPESLRVLEWHEYPSNCLPSNFDPTKLVTCKLPNSHFTSFGFLGSSNKFQNLTDLNFDNCQLLTRIPEVSDLPNLEKLSFERCKSLIAVEESIGFLNKLKKLKAKSCTKLRRFPPLNLPSLEKLELSYCSSLENFPEILGKIGNIKKLDLYKLGIKELPVSFQNLTGLHVLYISCDFYQLNSIVLTPKLVEIIVINCKDWKWVKSKDGEEEVGSSVFSDLRYFVVMSSNLNDNFFSAGFMQLTTLTSLYLKEINITFLPECIKEFHCLNFLNVNRCKRLEEIRGVPPNMKIFRAIECTSLTSSGSSMLLNQELHEVGETDFIFLGGSIPRWFDKQSRGHSISFWFRNKFPPKVLCLTVAPVLDAAAELVRPMVLINDKVQEHTFNRIGEIMLELDHMHLFGVRELHFDDGVMEMPLEKEWKHVEVTYEGLVDTSLIKAIGIHVVKEESRGMKDIRFDDPYTTTKVWPCNFFIAFLPFFFLFLLALILFTSFMAYPTQL